MSYESGLICKLQPWILKSVRVGGGRVFSGEELESRCWKDLKLEGTDEQREFLRVALASLGIYRTPAGDYYGCSLKEPAKRGRPKNDNQ